MITIINISDTKFSYNGINYFKNFTPFVTGNKVSIVNTYDACISLTNFPTIYSDISVDGVTYGSVSALQNALLPVLFNRTFSQSGSLGVGYIPKATGSNTLGNSLIYDNGSGIGINTTIPLSAFTVNGNLSLFTTNQIRLYNSAKNNWAEMSSPLLGGDTEIDFKLVTKSGIIYVNPTGNIAIGSTAPNYLATNRRVLDINGATQSMLALSIGGVGKSFLFYTGTDLLVSNESNGAIKLNTNGSQKVVIEAGGNVGIGTTSPNSKIQVVGVSGNPTLTAGTAAIATFTPNAVGNELVMGGSASSPFTFWMQNRHTGINDLAYPIALNPSGGNVGIGTTSPSYTLHVNGSVAGTSAYNNLSDKRYKKDILPIQNALDKILALNGVTFNWDKEATDMNLDDNNHIGLLAQDVEEILPQAVTTGTDENQTKSVAYTDLVPVLIEAIKELKAEIEILKTK
jgi:hypothetical protein